MNTPEITAAHQTLLNSPNHKVLTRAALPGVTQGSENLSLRTAAFINIETTGLDPIVDEVIQLSILPFTYALETNALTSAGPLESQYQQPREISSVPTHATAYNGLTDEMLHSAEFETDKLSNLLQNSDLLIAHNARFARPFLEKLIPLTREKPWACLRADVPWLAEGILKTNLEHLSMTTGVFYNPFDHAEKTIAGLHILTSTLPTSNEPTLSALRRSAGTPTRRILVTNPDPEKRYDFKARHYTWNNADSNPAMESGWWKDIPHPEVEAELAWIHSITPPDLQPASQIRIADFTALQRYSSRAMPMQ